jgi:hypothetical protein
LEVSLGTCEQIGRPLAMAWQAQDPFQKGGCLCFFFFTILDFEKFFENLGKKGKINCQIELGQTPYPIKTALFSMKVINYFRKK